MICAGFAWIDIIHDNMESDNDTDISDMRRRVNLVLPAHTLVIGLLEASIAIPPSPVRLTPT